MNEIRLWQIVEDKDKGPKVFQLDSVHQTKTEELLEEIIVRHPDLLLKDLKFVGRQTDTAGGPLDLLGVDGDGQLVVFELKRGNLTREAVAQIIDYASYLSELDPEKLSAHISERSGHRGIEKIDDFSAWYQEQFAKSLPNPLRPRSILVGLGADERTRRMVSFLANSEVDISLITFHAFSEGGRTFLARQVEVEAKPPTGTPGATKKDNLVKLQERVSDLGVGEFYYEMARFFQTHLSAAYQWPNQGGFSYYLPELTESGTQSNRAYVLLYLPDNRPGRTQVLLYPSAVEAAAGSFQTTQEALGGRVKVRPSGNAEVWIGSMQEWAEVTPIFEKLCSAIMAGWRKKRQQLVNIEFQKRGNDQSSQEKAA